MSYGSPKSLSPSEVAPCTELSPDATQPSVVVSDTACDCLDGTSHDGTYSFWMYLSDTWKWFDYGACKVSSVPEVAFVEVHVSCDAATGKWLVAVMSYQYNNDYIEGETYTSVLTLDAADQFVGVVEVDMFDGADVFACTFTLTFG